MFSKVKSPDNPMFSNVKEKWDKLDKECPRVLDLVEQNLKQKKTRTIAVVSNFLKEASPREDYRKVAELCPILLKVFTGPSQVTFIKPAGWPEIFTP